MCSASHLQTDDEPDASTGFTHPDAQSGFALMSVIWTIAIVASITLVALSISSAYVKDAGVQDRSVRLSAAADAGLYMAVDELLKREVLNPSPHDGTPTQASFSGIPLVISVQDTAGLVDLNTARPELLAALFEGLGASKAEASRLADEVVDWRDADQRPTGAGGEAPAYAAAGLPYGPKNSSFVSLNEASQLIHFPAPWLAQLDSVATLHSGLTGVDPTKISSRLANLLQLNPEANLQAEIDQQKRPYLAASSGRVFRIRSQAALHDAIFVRDATVQVNPGGFPAFEVLAWRQGQAISNTEIGQPR